MWCDDNAALMLFDWNGMEWAPWSDQVTVSESESESEASRDTELSVDG